MIRVYTAQAFPMVANVKNLLEADGIPCVLRNEFLNMAAGELPPIECWPEVWIIDDSDEERAKKLVDEVTGEAGTNLGDQWQCPNCGEEVEAIFARCWNCETERPD